jgi:hypothetical protein
LYISKKKMLSIEELSVGLKVTYIPFEGKKEYGIIKTIPNNNLTHIFVVFNCNGNWDNYQNYTGQLTPVQKLVLNWI